MVFKKALDRIGVTVIIFVLILAGVGIYLLLFGDSSNEIIRNDLCLIDADKIKLREPYPGVLAHGKQNWF